jgi:hypothetical protein
MKTGAFVLLAGCLVLGWVDSGAGQQPARPQTGKQAVAAPQPFGPIAAPLDNTQSRPSAGTWVGPAAANPAASQGPYTPAAPTYGPAAVPGFGPSPTYTPVPTWNNPTGTAAALPSAPTPGMATPPGGSAGRYASPGTYGGASGLPAITPTPAAFSDPMYGPYVPSAPSMSSMATPYSSTALPYAPTAAVDKPFTGYTPPPTYSPYMNLYRNNPRGLVDNYYSLVRPLAQQDNINQQMRGQIQGLEYNNQLQRAMLQRLNQQNEILQGSYRPNYFMNQGGYYPGVGFRP